MSVFFVRLGQGLAERRAAFFAEAFFAAVGGIAPADADAAPAVRAEELDIGGINRHLFGEPAALRIAAAGLEMAIGAIDPLDNDLAFFRHDAQHPARARLAGRAAVV